MKLCFAIQSLAIGGSSQVVVDLINQIKFKKDVDVSLIVFFNEIDKKYDSVLKDSLVTVYVLNKKKGFDIPFLFRLKNTIKKIDPDIISSHLTCTFYLNLVVNFRKTIVVHTIHNVPSADLPEIYRFALLPRIRSGKIKLVCCHEGLLSAATQLYGVLCFAVNNGIVISDDFKLHEPYERKVDVLMACRLTDVKRPEFFISLIKKVVDNGFKNLKAIVAGDGPNMQTALALTKELGLDDNVRFLGNVQNTAPLFQDSKIFVLTSTREGAPIAILEANSFGLPVVATSVGAVPNMIEDGRNGFVYEKDDIDRGASLLIKLLSDKALLSKMSHTSYDLASERTAKKMAEGYWTLFISWLKDKGRE